MGLHAHNPEQYKKEKLEEEKKKTLKEEFVPLKGKPPKTIQEVMERVSKLESLLGV